MLKKYQKKEMIFRIVVDNGEVIRFNKGIESGLCYNKYTKYALEQMSFPTPAVFCEILEIEEEKELLNFLKCSSRELHRKINSEIIFDCTYLHDKIQTDDGKTAVITFERNYTILSFEVRGKIKSQKNRVFPYLMKNKEIIDYFINECNQIELLSEKVSIKPGMYDIILEAGWCGLIFHETCGHCLESDNVIHGTSIFGRNDLNKQVSTPILTLVDDPHLQSGGYLEFDDEGNRTEKTVLIANGVLNNFITDEINADLLGIKNNGHGRKDKYYSKTLPRMTNTYILPGKNTVEDIFFQTNNGIYIKKVGAGKVNTFTGDFSFFVTEAEKIESSERTDRIKNFIVSDNNVRFINNIFAIADNLKVESGFCIKEGQYIPVGCGQPTIGIRNTFIY